ncbi:hypothetical protein [Ottowia thiooxydans]|nr:hypothetical protein [Ottowia thiooxydans]
MLWAVANNVRQGYVTGSQAKAPYCMGLLDYGDVEATATAPLRFG